MATGKGRCHAGAGTGYLSYRCPGSPESRTRRERLELAADGIRHKYGGRGITPGRIPGNDLGIQEERKEAEE